MQSKQSQKKVVIISQYTHVLYTKTPILLLNIWFANVVFSTHFSPTTKCDSKYYTFIHLKRKQEGNKTIKGCFFTILDCHRTTSIDKLNSHEKKITPHNDSIYWLCEQEEKKEEEEKKAFYLPKNWIIFKITHQWTEHFVFVSMLITFLVQYQILFYVTQIVTEKKCKMENYSQSLLFDTEFTMLHNFVSKWNSNTQTWLNNFLFYWVIIRFELVFIRFEFINRKECWFLLYFFFLIWLFVN